MPDLFYLLSFHRSDILHPILISPQCVNKSENHLLLATLCQSRRVRDLLSHHLFIILLFVPYDIGIRFSRMDNILSR